MKRQVLYIITCLAFACVSAPAQQAQITMSHKDASPGIQQHVDVQKNVLFAGSGAAQFFTDSVFTFDFTDRMVKGAPYSGDLTNETIQTLADGNRIVRRETTHMYRDIEGRTRREMKIPGFTKASTSGASASTSERETITISDPVAGFRYVLDPQTRTAFKMPLGKAGASFFLHSEAPPSAAGGEAAMAKGTVTSAMIGRVAGGGPGAVIYQQHVVRSADSEQPKTEPLGTQTIEGVEAEGSRSTTTIPAGQIGNERPIEIVSERWYSPKLQVALLTTHTDPRFGTTTSRLTNVSLNDPSRSLFEVPADYTVKEGPAKIEIRE